MVPDNHSVSAGGGRGAASSVTVVFSGSSDSYVDNGGWSATSDGNRAHLKPVMRRAPARPNRGNGSKGHRQVVCADGGREQGDREKPVQRGVDKDGALGLKYLQGSQGRHFLQSGRQCGDRDKLRTGETAWISMRPGRKYSDHEANAKFQAKSLGDQSLP